MGRVTSACDKEILLNKRNLALPHGSGEVPPFKRYSYFMRKFVATVSRYGGFESHVMGSHAA
jgi:hypothetical protein